MARRPTLSTNEWAVLGVVVDAPRHGYDIAAELSPGSDVGDAWRLSRQLVYRALDRLADLGLVEARRTEPGEAAPPRTVYGATRAGRVTLKTWLDTPVEHLRDVRGELLLKLVLARRLDHDTTALVDAQQDAFATVLDALAAQPPAGDPVAAWRHHSAHAVRALLDGL